MSHWWIQYFLVILCHLYWRVNTQQYMGQFHSFAHGVRSGPVTILDDKTILIESFFYDGQGPAGWFVLGKGQHYVLERVLLQDYVVIPDEQYSCNRLRQYNGETIQLTLPGDLRVSDFDYLSVYCLQFNHNFGYIGLPRNLNVASAPANNLGQCLTRWNSNIEVGPPQPRPIISNFLQGVASMFVNFFS